jgi:hypothetical protein
VLELLREKDAPKLRAISEPTRERGTLIARPVLAERRTSSFVAIEAPRATNALGAAQVSPLGHSAVPTAPPTPNRSTRMPRRKSSPPADEGSKKIEARLASTPSFGTPVPPSLPPPAPTLQNALSPPVVSPPSNLPPMSTTEPYATIDLEAPAAVRSEESPPVDTSGEHGFDLSELSEIRADHLVSKSFIYNISSLDMPEEPSQDIVLVDVPAADEKVSPPQPGGMFGGSLADHKSLADFASDLGIDHESDDLQVPISAENMVSPSMLSELEDDSANATRAKSDIQEIQRARREAQERMPTVLNTPREPSADEQTYQPDEWAAAEMKRQADSTAPEGGVDLITTSHSDIHAAELMSSGPNPTDENPLVSGDLDSTQSAMVSEMVSSFPDPNAYDPDEDLGAFRTINPEADAEIFPKVNGVSVPIDQETGGITTSAEQVSLDSISAKVGFEEVTPYWSMLDKVEPTPDQIVEGKRDLSTLPELSLSGSIDPGRAAVVSNREFDAMIDELRDVTASGSGFGDEEEMTENGSDSRALHSKRSRIADVKRQRRLR